MKGMAFDGLETIYCMISKNRKCVSPIQERIPLAKINSHGGPSMFRQNEEPAALRWPYPALPWEIERHIAQLADAGDVDGGTTNFFQAGVIAPWNSAAQFCTPALP